MKRAPYHYFEVPPKGGTLPKKAYVESSLVLGRVCLDVGFVVDKKLILVERSSPPMQGPWLAGGRIEWGNFTDIYEYASQSMHEHFGIASPKNKMTLLKPRFFCFKERPYPEAVFWVVGTITKRQYANISLNTKEQSHMHLFASKNELLVYMRRTKVSTFHRSIILDLWDELAGLGLLADDENASCALHRG